MRNTTEPLPFVPSGGKKNFNLAGGVELELLEKIAEVTLLGGSPLRLCTFREASHEFDVIPDPEDREVAEDFFNLRNALDEVIDGTPSLASRLQQRGKRLAYLVEQIVEVGVTLEGGEEDARLFA